DRRVVVAAGRADLVLGVRQFVLQAEEVLGRAELGVRLRDSEEAAEGGCQDVVRLARSGGRRCLLERGARPRDLVEDASLVRGVALDGLDEVRTAVAAPLELAVDVRTSRGGLVPQANESVVADTDEHEKDRDDA